jgi:hypothetical protein
MKNNVLNYAKSQEEENRKINEIRKDENQIYVNHTES